jgi:colanic acid biosynthesis glycosyl transferase WcaI
VFVVLYAGTVGPVQGPEVLIEAATELSSEPNVLFLLVAQGLSRPNMERMAREKQLSNVRFMDFQPRERLAEVQATADVSVVTLLAGQGRNFFPSKVLAYMAARRPVIASVDSQSDTARLVEESGGGRAVPPGDARALAEALRELRDAPGECQRLGDQARRHFEAHYSRRTATGVYEALFREVNEERRGGAHDPGRASGPR